MSPETRTVDALSLLAIDDRPSPDDALAELRRRREAGHAAGCCCHGRPGLACSVLRRTCLDAGLYREIQ